MRFVGWDIAVLDRWPVLLKGNALWDLDLTVLPHRIGISDTQFIPHYNHHLKDYWRRLKSDETEKRLFGLAIGLDTKL